MKRNQPEAAIQRAVCRHLELRGVPGLVWFAVPNQGARNPRSAAILKGLGVKAGVADLVLFHEGRAYALEIKASGGRLTPAQDRFLGDFQDAGGVVGHAVGLDDTLWTLESWGLIR